MADLPREPLINTPLRLSDIKAAIYGKGGFGGLRFDRVLYAGWSFSPAPGIVAKDIDRLGLDIRSFREPLVKAIRLVVMPSIRKNFERGGRPEPWPPLATYTISVRGNAWPILVRSGALKRVASSFAIWTIGETSASIRSLPSKVWYGNLHQEGYGSIGQIARKQLGPRAAKQDVEARMIELFMGATPARQQSKIVIPQREFALFQVEDIEKIQEIFIDWVEDRADRVGRSWNMR
jgi:phage gpG-like protein